ncbi:MAG: hypothetical protein QF596_04030 [Acidimicrobiales bacterium]|jgi:predicted metal-dependent HD superfamily phosphohydrolase|nr:hypothetical protein [Acidimicrobiales bacterium]MDP6298179.1 hypothetical protein [Acidimicrobiales bacterium]HJM28954.1 hypothetical protein [Acidimicrobiales bacterium]|tara:strand:+ start:170 stop:811 length:642 start_codon:yes stop_codon:yes gene_type:complete
MEIKDFDPMHRWFDLCYRNKVNVRAATLMCQQFIDSYGETHRYYHTLAHIHSCLNLLDGVLLEQNELNFIEYAVWFHDIIYDPISDTNEMQSAEVAEKWLLEQGISNASRVAHLIEQTADYGIDPPSDRMQAILHDLDLHVLGSTTDKYHEYAVNIRKEFKHLTNNDFFSGRSKFLKGLLARSSIYATESFKELFEQQAINNINKELGSLDSF